MRAQNESSSTLARAAGVDSAASAAIRAAVARTWCVASRPSITTGAPERSTTAAACGSA